MSETVYALYSCFKATRGFRDLDVDDAAQEVENLIKEWDPEVTVRGVYSTVGFSTSCAASSMSRSRNPRVALQQAYRAYTVSVIPRSPICSAPIRCR